MRILHTADIHLREVGDDRWSALKAVVDVCTAEGVNVLVIAGDLFDTSAAAEQLRSDLRDVFSRGDFHTIIIPGNHDLDAYRPGYYFGRGVSFFNSDSISDNLYDTAEARIIGLPYRDRDAFETARLLRELEAVVDRKRRNAVVYHGELLDSFYSREDFGPESVRRHMPTRLSHFKQLGVDYVLAGHFHTRFMAWEIGPDSFFVYPGSPVSISRKETGQRRLNLFEVGSEPTEYLLDTPHYCELQITFDPTEGKEPVQKVAAQLEQIHPSAKLMLTLDGYVTKGEAEIVDGVERLLESMPHDEPSYRFRDVNRILNHPLYTLISDRLDRRQLDNQKLNELQRLFLQAMTEAGV